MTKHSSSVKRRTQAPNGIKDMGEVRELQFCQEVVRKLQHVEKRGLSWNNEYLAPNTPSNENSCFN